MVHSRWRRRTVTVVSALAAAALSIPALSTPTLSAAAATPATGSTGSTGYDEPFRPQFHYSLPSGWIGDPNGLVFDDGKYYLFSFGTWQGATSTDLVHWTDIPVTGPAHDAGSSTFFSGSAVVDTNNTSGFGTRKNPPMVAMYTSVQDGTNIEKQSIAYSTDKGRTWTRYAGNPVLDASSVNFRDPKVFWYAPTQSWRMVITLSDQHKVAVYSSPDLKSWTHLSDFGAAGSTSGVWEMPDLYEMPVDGDARKTKWVLSVSVGSTGVQYFVGDFDGTTFTSDDPSTYTPPAGDALDAFESGSYGDWTTTGTAFGDGPATGALPDQQEVTGFDGTRLVDSFHGGDGSTGTLTSPAFTIDKQHLNFQVGGGNHPRIDGAVPAGTLPAHTVFADFSGDTYGDGWTATGAFANSGPSTEQLPGQLGPKALDTWAPDGDAGQGTISSPQFTIDSTYIDLQIAGGEHPWGQANPTAVNLVIDGAVVATATGTGSPTLTWTSWDVSRYHGQTAQIQVVDQNDGTLGWGHLMVGDILFADAPVQPWDVQTSVNLLVDGQVVRSATGSGSEALDWTSWNLADLQGRQARIQIVDANTGGWGHILADDFRLSDQPALSTNQRAHWIDFGSDFYAFNTWNGTKQNERIGVAWMSNWDYAGQVPTSPWQGAETLPRTMKLATLDGRAQLVQQPVAALSSLRTGPPVKLAGVTASDAAVPLNVAGTTLDLTTRLTAGSAKTFGLDVRTGSGQYTRIGYDAVNGQVFVDRTHSGDVGFSSAFPGVTSAPLALDHGAVTLRILVDRDSVEVYAGDGRVTLTDQVFPDATSGGVRLFATGGTATLQSLNGWHLKSSWR
ncbi:glycosyl hydrolase family 32 [Microbacterium mangrovi]|uniref:Glycosyl hydrolase family 32 n=1 Tax=Microbacterium mangrovi TaxID=1348253 RepID=A0A0B2A8S8_9MICO|nr:glycoside hydrolase family 32 protein [Microbacterium mangrovi]KHK99963.1 glycosyl hydrolase family 32 [Microbacterium mangrovi]